MRQRQAKRGVAIIAVCICVQLCVCALAFGQERDKVLVVMSYEKTYPGEVEMRKAIDEILAEADIRYVYLDTKSAPEAGPAKAKAAYALYQDFQPDLVIAADDNAQSLFVLPYILKKTTTPVVFCGVNDDATKYGYPNEQVTGILEKKHYKQSIQFARLIEPKIEKIAVIYKESPSNDTNIAQIQKEQNEYGVTITDFIPVRSTEEVDATLATLKESIDALLVLNVAGIDNAAGEKMGQKAAFAYVVKEWPKPSIGASENEIKHGVLCAVAKRNIEQGMTAAGFAKRILAGVPVSDIPVSQNRKGQRAINVTTARRLGINLKPMILIGTELVQ